MRTHNIPSYYRKSKENLILPPDLALSSTLIGSNYPCLELIFMVPKVFVPSKFYYIILWLTLPSQYRVSDEALSAETTESSLIHFFRMNVSLLLKELIYDFYF